MFDISLLKLSPKRVLCPICGQWHDWNNVALNECYDSNNAYELYCPTMRTDLFFWFDFSTKSIHISSDSVCDNLKRLENTISFKDVKYGSKNSTLQFTILISPDTHITRNACDFYCKNYVDCYLYKCSSDFHFEIPVEGRFEFDRIEFDKCLKRNNENETSIDKKTESTIKQEDLTLNEAATTSINVIEKPTQNTNIYNISYEYGLNTDTNIASTLMGIAVRCGNNWRIFDKKKKEIIDIGNIQFNSLPLVIIPTTKLSEGDLIKDDNNYYYVLKVEGQKTETLSVRTGEIKTVIPIKNFLGFSCYSKVVTFIDILKD